jgi:electron transfer flavoprotein alpha subunit
VTAIVTGSGADLDTGGRCGGRLVCQGLQIGQLDALAYPNAEVVRKLLVNVLPADAIVLIPHDTFGMDLAPACPSSWIRPSWPTWWISKASTAAP